MNTWRNLLVTVLIPIAVWCFRTKAGCDATYMRELAGGASLTHASAKDVINELRERLRDVKRAIGDAIKDTVSLIAYGSYDTTWRYLSNDLDELAGAVKDLRRHGYLKEADEFDAQIKKLRDKVDDGATFFWRSFSL